MTHKEETENFIGHLIHDDEYDEPDDDGCYECGGEGWVTADCFEDTCCCADPETQHGIEPCYLCNPDGSR